MDHDLQEKIQSYLDLLPGLHESLEKSHPNMRSEVVLWHLSWSLQSLRHLIESDSEEEITWANPFVELHFPVDCDWQSEDSETPPFTVTFGSLSAEDMETKEAVVKALTRIAVKQHEILGLQEMVNGTAFEKRGDNHIPVLPIEIIEELEKIDDTEERKKQLEQVMRPCSFGAGSIDYGDIDGGDPIPSSAYSQIEAIQEPLVAIPITVDDLKLRVIAILEIHPMIADSEKKEAYFPIVTGIAIQQDDGTEVAGNWFDIPWTSFENWPDEDRRAIFDAFEKILDDLLQGLRSDPKVEEALIEISASIRVPVRMDDPAALERIHHQMISALHETGEIEHVKLSHNSEPVISAETRRQFQELLDAVERAETNQEKGDSLEDLMVALFGSVPGFTVLQNISTQTEEIDLWIENENERGPFRQDGEIVLVECKNWSTNCGKNEFVLLQKKAENRGHRCSLAFLISWKGFAETVTKEMLRGSREKLLIVPIDGDSITSAIETGDFFSLLKMAKRDALAL
ncbi:MAG: hypothetical protein WD342_00680 [Verrucomicrobiales bacterium]